mgnify:CR=1 FL=1
MSSGHNKSPSATRSNPAPAKQGAAQPAESPQPAVSAAARDFLDLFYPVHYKIGIGIEDALRGGRLTRHQVAILWLIRSEGEGGKRLARKEIERSITRWFEIGNSAISKALRVLAKPPYELLAIVENPLSARERYVLLTPAGEQQIEWMVGQGHRFLQRMVDHLNADESAQGVHFLTRVSAIIDIVEREKPVAPAGLAAAVEGLKPRRARR